MKSKVLFKCAICDRVHELEVLDSGKNEFEWVKYFCPITKKTFTHYGTHGTV